MKKHDQEQMRTDAHITNIHTVTSTLLVHGTSIPTLDSSKSQHDIESQGQSLGLALELHA